MTWNLVFLLIGSALTGSALLTVFFQLMLCQRGITYHFDDSPHFGDTRFRRLLLGMVPLMWSEQNEVQLLQNGEEAFPAMIEAVEQARHTVTFENYVYWSGDIGRRFAKLLAKKSREGVRVEVVLDWIGAGKMERTSIDEMQSAGVEVHFYHRPRLGWMHALNHRTHRRELVVDGRIAFTGGIGLGDEWCGDGNSDGCWRDNHYRIEGPMAGAVQSVFLDNWLKSSGAVLADAAYFPELRSAGTLQGGILADSPGERISSGRLMIQLLVRAARRSICIEQAYFIPDPMLIEALVNAAQRGVNVEIILPNEQIDFRVVRWASRSLWKPLLEAGVRIYEYQPSMLHVKMMLIDDLWLLTGSANLDYRSLYRNDETYLAVADEDFAERHAQCFAADRERSREVSLTDWYGRSLSQKLLDSTSALIRTQL